MGAHTTVQITTRNWPQGGYDNRHDGGHISETAGQTRHFGHDGEKQLEAGHREGDATVDTTIAVTVGTSVDATTDLPN